MEYGKSSYWLIIKDLQTARCPLRTVSGCCGCFCLEFFRGVDAKRGSGSLCFSLEFFCSVMRDEGVDGGLEHAFHHHRQLVVG